MRPTASNYDPDATVAADCLGCTNDASGNYDATADVDDGSCEPLYASRFENAGCIKQLIPRTLVKVQVEPYNDNQTITGNSQFYWRTLEDGIHVGFDGFSVGPAYASTTLGPPVQTDELNATIEMSMHHILQITVGRPVDQFGNIDGGGSYHPFAITPVEPHAYAPPASTYLHSLASSEYEVSDQQFMATDTDNVVYFKPLAPGDYFYFCPTHASQMYGRIRVSPNASFAMLDFMDLSSWANNMITFVPADNARDRCAQNCANVDGALVDKYGINGFFLMNSLGDSAVADDPDEEVVCGCVKAFNSALLATPSAGLSSVFDSAPENANCAATCHDGSDTSTRAYECGSDGEFSFTPGAAAPEHVSWYKDSTATYNTYTHRTFEDLGCKAWHFTQAWSDSTGLSADDTSGRWLRDFAYVNHIGDSGSATPRYRTLVNRFNAREECSDHCASRPWEADGMTGGLNGFALMSADKMRTDHSPNCAGHTWTDCGINIDSDYENQVYCYCIRALNDENVTSADSIIGASCENLCFDENGQNAYGCGNREQWSIQIDGQILDTAPFSEYTDDYGARNFLAMNWYREVGMDYDVVGCTDSNATNYLGATVDDGSCEYAGCMNRLATNYDSRATIEPAGACLGCSDSTSTNYANDPSITEDGTCDDGCVIYAGSNDDLFYCCTDCDLDGYAFRHGYTATAARAAYASGDGGTGTDRTGTDPECLACCSAAYGGSSISWADQDYCTNNYSHDFVFGSDYSGYGARVNISDHGAFDKKLTVPISMRSQKHF